MKPAAILSLLLSAEVAFACLTPEERGEAPAPGLKIRQSGTGAPIGTGDRFSDGTIAPQGLGSRSTSSSFATILSAAEVTSGLQALASTYGLSTFTTPYTTYEGRSILGAKVGGTGGTCNDAYHVYLNGAIHARERSSADGVLYFISDLLYANKAGTGLTYGSKTYTNAQVKTALSAGIVFVPLSNPDGVVCKFSLTPIHPLGTGLCALASNSRIDDQSSNSCWRKNRNPASSTGSAASIGVDLNRNFDFVWDYTEKFSETAVDGDSLASTNPTSEIYHGAYIHPDALLLTRSKLTFNFCQALRPSPNLRQRASNGCWIHTPACAGSSTCTQLWATSCTHGEATRTRATTLCRTS